MMQCFWRWLTSHSSPRHLKLGFSWPAHGGRHRPQFPLIVFILLQCRLYSILQVQCTAECCQCCLETVCRRSRHSSQNTQASKSAAPFPHHPSMQPNHTQAQDCFATAGCSCAAGQGNPPAQPTSGTWASWLRGAAWTGKCCMCCHKQEPQGIHAAKHTQPSCLCSVGLRGCRSGVRVWS